MVKRKRAVRPDHGSLLPLRVRWCDPADLGADSGLVCRADDGCDYLIKDKISGESTAETPHSEWFCSSLAEAVGIAVPPHRVLEMIDGTMVFGSRWEGGVLESKPWEAEHWWEKVQRGEIKLNDIKSTLSRVYAFDNFINNTDRHCENFIVRAQRSGFVFLANDYSRAWLRHGFPLPRLPMHGSQTVESQRNLTKFWKTPYIVEDECGVVLDKLSTITKDRIRTILRSQPEDWLTPTQEHDILKWWGSKAMLERIKEIGEGIADGSYL